MPEFYEKDGPQWRDWHSRKEYLPDRNAWGRKTDCLIAERIFGYRWLSCSPHRDFCGYPFHQVLTHPNFQLDGAYILEPDTRVPNFSTDLGNALTAARKTGLRTIQILPTDEEMAAMMCRQILAGY